jgi:hypothetical protein
VIQLSSANAIAIADINHDDRPDLVIGGNNFNFPPQFGRLDASFGDVLLNRGGGKFETMNSQESGLDLRGEVRDIKLVKGKRKNICLSRLMTNYRDCINSKINDRKNDPYQLLQICCCDPFSRRDHPGPAAIQKKIQSNLYLRCLIMIKPDLILRIRLNPERFQHV